MIVIKEGDHLRLITQSDHAHFAAELLSLCRFPELLAHPRRQQLLEATREHDNGWRGPDAAPSLDPTSGLPHSYLTLPSVERQRIWNRACSQFRDADPYVAALITLHALAIHRRPDGDADWTDWFARTEGLRDELVELTGCELATLLDDYALLRFADLCSLAACGATPEPFQHHGVSGHSSDGTLYLDPLPLAGSTSFRIACRRIPRKTYASATDLGTALASAPWERQAVRVAASVG